MVYEALTGLPPFREAGDEDGAAGLEHYSEKLHGLAHPTDVRERNPTVRAEVAAISSVPSRGR